MNSTPQIHATEVGTEGERVVFLHGLFGQGRNFSQIAKALRPQLRSVLVDLPNHGRSEWTEQADYVTLADAVAQWLEAEYDGRSHLVGHSMGGKVAMVLAVRHPELVDRLVVADISPVDREGTDGGGEFEHLLDSLGRLDLEEIDRRSEADDQLAQWVGDERVRGFLLQNLRSSEEGFAWQANLDLLRAELSTIEGFPDLEGRFDRPVLWVAGGDSPYVQPEHAAPMKRLFPRTTSVTVKGAGHWLHSEQPEAFVSALRAFLLAER